MIKRKVGVLISGNGSNLQALIDACAAPDYPAEITAVIANNDSAYGLNRARNAGIPAHIVLPRDYPSREAFDEALQGLLDHHGVEFVCLAGFMRLLSLAFVTRWRHRLLNIHPSLLPAFKGTHAHAQAIKAGVRISGCTVHFVTPEMDAGPIIVQAAVPVLPGDSEETLAARILAQEHRCYPMALRWLAEGKLEVEREKVVIREGAFGEEILVNPHPIVSIK